MHRHKNEQLADALRIARALSNQTLIRPKQAAAMLGISYMTWLSNQTSHNAFIPVIEWLLGASVIWRNGLIVGPKLTLLKNKEVVMSKLETYAALAPKLLDAGYEVLPIVPNQKRPNIQAWTTINFRDPKTVEQYISQCPSYGVGVKTGDVVVIDIDCPQEGLAIEFQNRCFSVLGEAPVRIGNAQKGRFITV